MLESILLYHFGLNYIKIDVVKVNFIKIYINFDVI